MSPRGPWFYGLLVLAQVAVVFLVTRVLAVPFGLTLATLFASEGIASLVIAWILTGLEGSVRGGLWARWTQVPIPAHPDLPPYAVEAERQSRMEASHTPLVFVLAAYGVLLLVLAFLLAV